ncbi:hypothetical protein [Acidiphilium sp.]|uniref:hypothetical protein n=1 Tax=Acidiphilium sp. TaxID=527 RepID=UPI003D07A1E6
MARRGWDARAAASGDPDDTVPMGQIPSRAAGARTRPPATRLAVALIVSIAAVTGVGIGGWMALRRPDYPKAGETGIFNHVGRHFTIFRFRDDPLILVIDCPNLRAQGMMFDRIAALIEKASTPRNRVLGEAAFRKVLAKANATEATYYYGNDYPAWALRKFFRLAHAEGIRLTADERRLREIARREGFLRPGANGAVISIPQAQGSRRISWVSRAVILRHELSHGAYFTIPSYRRFVHRFYDTQMTPSEQAAFRSFLIRDGYDPHDRDLIVNETIAYMVFTRDPDYFNAQAVGLTDAQLASLRQRFVAQMPHFWLRPMADAPLPAHR